MANRIVKKNAIFGVELKFYGESSISVEAQCDLYTPLPSGDTKTDLLIVYGEIEGRTLKVNDIYGYVYGNRRVLSKEERKKIVGWIVEYIMERLDVYLKVEFSGKVISELDPYIKGGKQHAQV